VLVMKFVQVGAVFQLGFQARGVKLGCSSRGVQVRVRANCASIAQ
jgi:hypothetical protein